MPELSKELIAILQLAPKNDMVKQESDKLDEVKTSALSVIAELPKIPEIREFLFDENYYISSMATYIAIHFIGRDPNYADMMKIIRSDKSLSTLWVQVAGSDSTLSKL